MNVPTNSLRVLSAFVLSLAPLLANGQLPGVASSKPLVKQEAVEYLYPEQLTIPAGKAHAVDLHFRIAQGLHINSHTPGDEYLIATQFSIPAGAGVSLDSAQYPPGNPFTPEGSPGTRLNVYTGEFTIHAALSAEHGDHLVEAKLRYQACDQSACMPPRTISVPIDVVGK